MVNISKNNNKIYSYLIIILALFILVLFTKTQFERIQLSLDEKHIAETELQSVRNKVEALNNIEALYNENPEIVSKYLVDFREDEIIDYIYSSIEEGNMWDKNWIALVRSLSLKEWSVNEVGFLETDLLLNLRIPSESRMIEILDFFIKEDSKYKFFIDSFNLPNSTSSSWFNVTVPLKIFYK